MSIYFCASLVLSVSPWWDCSNSHHKVTENTKDAQKTSEPGERQILNARNYLAQLYIFAGFGCS